MKFSVTKLITTVISFFVFNSSAFSQLSANFTVNTPSGCAPLIDATFTSTTTGGTPTSYLWYFGDGFTSSVPSPLHTYSAAGNYTVSLVVSDGSTTDSIAKLNFITVFNNPIANYTLSDSIICSGEAVTFTSTSIQGDAAIDEYRWTFNDGSPPDISGSVVSHVYVNSGTTPATLTPSLVINDLNNCNSTNNDRHITINPAATASWGIDPSSSACSLPAIVTFTNSSTGTAIYNWNFGDPGSGVNNTSTQATPTHVYTATGSYLVTLQNGYPGCEAIDTMTIHVAPPIANFDITDATICPGDSAFFTNTNVQSGVSYRWTFGDGSPTFFGTDASHRYLNPGNYTVTLTAQLGICSNSTTKTVTVHPRPTINFTAADRQHCAVPFNVSFTETSGTNVSWMWNFGDPASGASNTSTSQNPTHSYNAFGNYNVSIVVTDNNGCKDSVTQFNFIQIAPPVADFTAIDSGCIDKNFVFNSTSISPFDPITNYTWDFGDGSPAQTVNTPGTTHLFLDTGIFDVTLTITTASGCTADTTLEEFIRVGIRPNAQIDSIPSFKCFKDTINFYDASPQPPNITGWQWYFGDGGRSTDQNPNHKFELDTSGTTDPFDIILIAYHHGCADSDTVVNMVTIVSPIPLFEVEYNCINPDSVNFINLSGGANTYQWDFGDTTALSTDTNPTHIYPGRGTWDVILTATNNTYGCTVDSVLPVHITHISADIGPDTISHCYPENILFNGSGSVDASSFLWDFGDPASINNSSILPGDTHTYSVPGFYTVKLFTTDIHGCTDSAIQIVHMIGPVAGFTATPATGCLNPDLSVTFSDASTTEGGAISQWTWNYGTGEPVEITSSASVVHSFVNPGLFDITLIVEDVNGCIDTLTIVDYINPANPVASIILPDTIGCRNIGELLTGSAGPPGFATLPVTYEWDFGDSQTFSDTVNQVNHAYANNGVYHIFLRVEDANGCWDTISRNILIHTTPGDFTLAELDSCIDQGGIKKLVKAVDFTSVYTDYTSTGSSWVYDLSVGQNPPPVNFPGFHFEYNEPPGSYNATVYLTNDLGCVDTFTYPDPIIIYGDTGSFSFTPDSGCSPLTVNFTGSSQNVNLYAWDFGDGSVVSGTSNISVSHTYLTAGNYVPRFYLAWQLGTSTCYLPTPIYDTVKVTSLLGVDILEDSIYVTFGERDTLTVVVTDPIGGPPYTYNWTPSGEVIEGPFPGTFLATTTGQDQYYYVSVPYGSGCSGIDSVFVRFRVCEALLNIPNVFTPDDGNKENNTYQIKELCNFDEFLFRIYNRWGRIVYETNQYNFQWDGTTTGGSKAADGVYYYVLNAKTQALHGWIELIRHKN